MARIRAAPPAHAPQRLVLQPTRGYDLGRLAFAPLLDSRNGLRLRACRFHLVFLADKRVGSITRMGVHEYARQPAALFQSGHEAMWQN